MHALVDCNNFYASCERLFRPDLQNKPIVVLSNNDGCIIARSNEAKTLGLKMGQPYFQVQSLCKQKKVHVFSSNFALYNDLSQRVMCIIEEAWPAHEIYSIDEAFLDLNTLPTDKQETFCSELQGQILKKTGIPTSIGIGLTKTLAKLANFFCKKKLPLPVFNITPHKQLLNDIDVGEVWGIGRRWHKRLISQGIYTVKDLMSVRPSLLRQQFNVIMQKIAMELNGVPCLGLEVPRLTKSILSSRSFIKMQTELEYLSQAVSGHCRRVTEKLRRQGLSAKNLQVFIRTNRFRKDLTQCSRSFRVAFNHPTDDLRLITHYAKQCLTRLYEPGFCYKKVGVCLEELVSRDSYQLNLFDDEKKIIRKTQKASWQYLMLLIENTVEVLSS